MIFKNHKELVVPTIVSILFGFLYYFYFPLLSIYFKTLGISDELLGVLFSLFPLVMIFFSPIIGILSDHVGRKRIIYLGVLAQFVAVVLYLWPPALWSIVIARIFAGISWAMVGLITLAKIEDKLKEHERGSKAGLFLSLGQVGIMFGTFLGPIFAHLFFIRFPFIISAVGMALLLVWLVLWRSHHKPEIQKKDFNPLTAINRFLKEKKLKAMAFIGMARHTSIAVITIFLPLLVLEFGGGFKEVGLIFGLRGAMHLLQGFAGKMVDKKGSRNMIIISVIVCSVFLMLAGLSKTFVDLLNLSSLSSAYIFLLIFLVIEALSSSFWNVSAWTFMSEIGVRKKMEGVVVGSYNSLAKIGHFVFAIVSGFIVVAFGISSLFIISGAIGLIVVLSFSPRLASKYKAPSKKISV